MKQANIERAKSAPGILLVGVGILLLRQEMNQTVTHFSHTLRSVPNGMLPMVVIDTAHQAWQPGFNHVLQHVLYQVFVTVWPLLLVSIGMGLSSEFRR